MARGGADLIRERAGLFRVKLLGAGLFWTAVQSEAKAPLLPRAEPRPMVPARAPRAAKAVAPSGRGRALPPQSKVLTARILGRGTSRAREQRPKFLASYPTRN